MRLQAQAYYANHVIIHVDPIVGDIDHDGLVNASDLMQILAGWGSPPHSWISAAIESSVRPPRQFCWRIGRGEGALLSDQLDWSRRFAVRTIPAR